MTYKSYIRLFVAVFITTALTGLSVSLMYRLQSLDGDLTRLGWLSEYDYGHSNPEYNFSPPLSHKGDINATYDIVIIGDSFSNRSPFGGRWHNYLSRDTGLSVGVFHLNDVDVDGYLNSTSFKTHPPRIIIYQSIEREIKNRFSETLSSCKTTSSQADIKPVAINPTAVTPIQKERNNEAYVNIGYGLKFLWKQFFTPRKVLKMALTTDKLFSNRKPEELLVIRYDIKKTKWPDNIYHQARCQMMTLQQRAQANGLTQFIMMVTPDKLTAYSPYLSDKKLRNTSHYQELFINDSLNITPLLSAFHQELERGMTDLYLPNNTHWSSTGGELAARETVHYMLQKGIMRYSHNPK